MRKANWNLRMMAWILAVGTIGISAPARVLASSPEFSRTAEEWSALQDDNLEYSEIADLIHEYNPTVQNNQYEYQKFIKDYGTTREDVSNSYLDLAEDLEASKSGDDSGSGRVSDLSLEVQAKSLREQADNNLEDSRIYYLNYAQAEANLVLSAQSKFLSYYKNQLQLEEAQATLTRLKQDYELAQTKRSAGTITDADVLTALEAVQTQENTIQKMEQQVESARQSLIVMLGWDSSDNPTIGELPEVDLSVVDQIDLSADQQTALENNYTLLVNQRKLENAVSDDTKRNLNTTIAGNERKIRASVASAYQNLKNAKLAYEQAQASLTTQERQASLSDQKLSAGMITAYENQTQQIALTNSRLALKEASISYQDALETYRWNVNGLASAE
ncbi:TolC family protein [Brotaphodocola sp.]|uniref:TolC family protein n=1 Tax=Brotaphodocola sp. TaxID=3073577 RepID=UPI003D7EB355